MQILKRRLLVDEGPLSIAPLLWVDDRPLAVVKTCAIALNCLISGYFVPIVAAAGKGNRGIETRDSMQSLSRQPPLRGRLVVSSRTARTIQ